MTARPGRRRTGRVSAIQDSRELFGVRGGPAAGEVLADVGGGSAVLGLPRREQRSERAALIAGGRVRENSVLLWAREDNLAQPLEVRPTGLAGEHDLPWGIGEIIERAEKARKGSRSALEISREKRE